MLAPSPTATQPWRTIEAAASAVISWWAAAWSAGGASGRTTTACLSWKSWSRWTKALALGDELLAASAADEEVAGGR
jgi:hypothetical protein